MMMNKKMLYFALSNLEDRSDGVTQKIYGQIEGFKKNNYDCYIAGYTNNGVAIYSENNTITKSSRYRRWSLVEFTSKAIGKLNLDVAYIRFAHFTPGIMRLLKKMSKFGIKIYIEIPSYPIKYTKSLKGFIFRQFDKCYFPKIKKYVHKILSVGEKISHIYGIENISIPNGINSHIKFIKKPYNNNYDSLNFISVSGMYLTHGNDRIIKGFKNYYDENPESNIKLHFVGSGSEEEKLQRMVHDFMLDKKIFFHGKKEGKELEELYSKCDIGVSAIGIHRIGYSHASPLKSKDYLMRGIPFICSYQEIGISENQPFIFSVPANDEPIDIFKVVSDYKSLGLIDYHKKIEKLILEEFNWEYILEDVV